MPDVLVFLLGLFALAIVLGAFFGWVSRGPKPNPNPFVDAVPNAGPMKEYRHDGSIVSTTNLTFAVIRAAIDDPRNRSVVIHRPDFIERWENGVPVDHWRTHDEQQEAE